MQKFTKSKKELHSDHALLCLIAEKCRQAKLLDPLYDLIKINQKTVRHSPVDKLLDMLIAILIDCQAVSQINTKLAQAEAVLRAFGREQCADQSTVQRTLSSCDFSNVAELQTALAEISAANSRIRHHKYHKQPLILDIDLSGLPCSKHYEGSCKGYFADCKPGTTGRQLYRVSASQYNEIVYQKVFPGNTTSATLSNFKLRLTAAFAVLGLKTKHKRRILIRLDGGFGNDPIINYLLEEGYQFVLKLGNAPRAIKLCRSVAGWQADQCHRREFGLVEAATTYEKAGLRKVYQLGVRHRPPEKPAPARPKKLKAAKKPQKAGAEAAAEKSLPGQPAYHYNVLVLCVDKLNWDKPRTVTAQQMLTQVHFYDSRAGIETASFKSDKQGLSLIKRRKVSLAGQEILILLSQLAHNLLVWATGWLAQVSPTLGEFGIQRWVRDLLTIAGQVSFKAGRLVKVYLTKRNRLARQFYKGVAKFFATLDIEVVLGYP